MDALFELDKLITERFPERIRIMYRMYGQDADHRCGDCRFFHRYSQGARWAKCDLTVQTGGAGTDWRSRWLACGKWESAE